MQFAFPPRDESLNFVLMLNTHYRAHGLRDITAVMMLGEAEVHLHVDLEGLLVWIPEYLRLRVSGYAHLAAVDDVLAQINDIWFPDKAPHPRPAPPAVEPAPAPAPEPPTEIPGDPTSMSPLGRMIRFAQFYLARCHALQWGPDLTTSRQSRVDFLREAIIEYRAKYGDKSFVMKRAAPGNPISDDVVVFMDPRESGDYRRYWDFITSAGVDTWSIKRTQGELGDGDILPDAQPLVDPVTLQIIIG